MSTHTQPPQIEFSIATDERWAFDEGIKTELPDQKIRYHQTRTLTRPQI